MAFEVSTPVFQGPVDVLLQLVVREQVDLGAVSLAALVDAYVAEIERLGGADLEDATGFLLVAAALVELKVRRLLPEPDPEIDVDEELGGEERDLLLARLLQGATFRAAGSTLEGLARRAARSVPRRAGPDERFAGLVPDLLSGVTPDRLRAAYEAATAPLPVPMVDLAHVTVVRASVADAVAGLLVTLPQVGRRAFRHLAGPLTDRFELVVRFLAVLELYKQGLVELDQSEPRGELEVIWIGDAVPGPELVSAVDAYGPA